MMVYVASRFSDAGKAITREVYAELRAKGHGITHDWTEEDVALHSGKPIQEIAYDDFYGVLYADAVIIAPRFEGCRGAWVEFGIALAKNIPIIVIGQLDAYNVFEHLPRIYHVDTPAAAVAKLGEIYG